MFLPLLIFIRKDGVNPADNHCQWLPKTLLHTVWSIYEQWYKQFTCTFGDDVPITFMQTAASALIHLSKFLNYVGHVPPFWRTPHWRNPQILVVFVVSLTISNVVHSLSLHPSVPQSQTIMICSHVVRWLGNDGWSFWMSNTIRAVGHWSGKRERGRGIDQLEIWDWMWVS